MSAQAVLLIDDDADLRETITLVLESAGYETWQAQNGLEALAVLGRKLPDLILLDMRMPVMNGWEFAEHFHRRYDKRVPIVIFTAANDAEKSAQQLGADGWLNKPCDLDTLLEMVRAHLARPPEHRSGG